MNTHLGKDVATKITTGFENVADKQVSVVKCAASARPVHLRSKANEEEFYVRAGPSSSRLSVGEANQYIRERFKDA